MLFLANGLLFARRYEQHSAWYSKKITEVREKPSTISTVLCPAPAQLAFIAEAGDNQAPAGYSLSPLGVVRPLPAGPRNVRFPAVPEPDWSFIIKVIFSLYAILIGYDAIAGEKERGTLRQMLTGPLGRARLLIAKYAAGILTLGFPLLCGMIISLVTVALSVPRVLTPSVLSDAVLTFFLGMVYLSLFAFLSLFVSSLLHDSSLVLLTLLVVWIFFTIIIPNTAGILSEEISAIPSEFSIAKELGPAIEKQVWDKIRLIEGLTEKGEITSEEELKRRTDQAFNEGQQSLISFYNSYEKAVRGRAEVARSISRLSPTALFQYAAEDISGTGIHGEERFLGNARAYSEVYDRYIRGKTGKLVASSGYGFGTFIELNGKQVYISSPRAEEYPGDMSDFPRFVESPRPAGEGVKKALMDLAGLLLWNIVLACGAIGAIMRSDVR